MDADPTQWKLFLKGSPLKKDNLAAYFQGKCEYYTNDFDLLRTLFRKYFSWIPLGRFF